jgi:hypothetical protein
MQDWEVAARVLLPCDVSAEGRALAENISSRPTPRASVRRGRGDQPKALNLHHDEDDEAATPPGRLEMTLAELRELILKWLEAKRLFYAQRAAGAG